MPCLLSNRLTLAILISILSLYTANSYAEHTTAEASTSEDSTAEESTDTVYLFGASFTDDFRQDYPNTLLTTALEKTQASFGDFNIVYEPPVTNSRQMTKLMQGQKAYVIQGIQRPLWDNLMRPIRVPLTKGMMSLRIFLIDKAMQPVFSEVSSLDELKKLSLGSGHNWATTQIYQYHNFNVQVFYQYGSMFNMLTAGRFDYIPRGAHEAVMEIKQRADNKSLAIEESIVLDVAAPVYFYVSKDNEALAVRIEEGLKMMISDGSFDQIFDQYYADDLRKLNLKNRKIFHLENPFLPEGTPIYDVIDLIDSLKQ